MYQFMMEWTASWKPHKEIYLYLECLAGMKDLMDTGDFLKARIESSSNNGRLEGEVTTSYA